MTIDVVIRRLGSVSATTLAAVLVAGCVAESGGTGTGNGAGTRTSPPGSAPAASYGPQIVHYAGVREIRFGDLKADLTAKGRLSPQVEGCSHIVTGAPELGPVFDGERLVLLWVSPPYRTPEGVTVGTSIADVRQAYPTAARLDPPKGSEVFPGLLATQGDHGYLFLHDDATVQKLIVGFTEYLQRLYQHGFGQC